MHKCYRGDTSRSSPDCWFLSPFCFLQSPYFSAHCCIIRTSCLWWCYYQWWGCFSSWEMCSLEFQSINCSPVDVGRKKKKISAAHQSLQTGSTIWNCVLCVRASLLPCLWDSFVGEIWFTLSEFSSFSSASDPTAMAPRSPCFVFLIQACSQWWSRGLYLLLFTAGKWMQIS